MTRILLLCSSWPLAKGFGGQLRAFHLGQALKQVGRVSVLMVGSDAGDTEALAKTAEEFEVLPPILPIRSPSRNGIQKLRWALDVHYLNLHGVTVVSTERERLDSVTERFDLIWILNSRTPNILQRWHWPRTHLDIDDIPSTYLRTVAQNATGIRERWRARVQQMLLHRREVLLPKRFTTLSVCSEADKAYLKNSKVLHVIPNGFERPEKEPRWGIRKGPRIGFIGLFSYAPNNEGVRWFLQECWPTVRKLVPDIRLRLVGKDTDGPLSPVGTNIDSLGWVADPAEEIATWSAMIVPIRVGGGTRIKIAEAFSRRCPVVSTPVGAFGYEVEHEKQLMLAESPADFSSACVKLIEDPKLGAAIADRAWNMYINKWTWDAIAPKIWKAAEDCLRQSAAPN